MLQTKEVLLLCCILGGCNNLIMWSLHIDTLLFLIFPSFLSIPIEDACQSHVHELSSTGCRTMFSWEYWEIAAAPTCAPSLAPISVTYSSTNLSCAALCRLRPRCAPLLPSSRVCHCPASWGTCAASELPAALPGHPDGQKPAWKEEKSLDYSNVRG